MGRDATVLRAVSCLPLASCCWAARSELNGHQGSHHQSASQPAVWSLTSREGAALAGRQHRAGWKGPGNRMGGLQGETRSPWGRVARGVSHERSLQRPNSRHSRRGIRRMGRGCRCSEQSSGLGKGWLQEDPVQHSSTSTLPPTPPQRERQDTCSSHCHLPIPTLPHFGRGAWLCPMRSVSRGEGQVWNEGERSRST